MARGIMLFRPLILQRQLSTQGHHSLAATKIINAWAEIKTSESGGGQDRSIGNHSLPQKSLATPPFQKLVESLKSTGQTCTIIESSCGGLISSSLMSVPGSSKVYFGGTVCRLLLICFAFNWVFDFSTSSGTFNFYRSHIIQKRVASCYVMTISIADS